jgi:F-type H+-transporting ATPase subunit a
VATQQGAEGGGHEGGLGIDPMHQFEIKRLVPIDLFGLDASFTNSSLFMLIAVAAIAGLTVWGMSGRALVPGRLQSVAELAYEFVASMVRDNVGSAGQKYFPFIFSLFMFVLAANMIGMIPYSFTVTSHIVVTFALAMVVFIGVTIIGFARHGVGFLKFFVPSGVPMALLPLLVVIEVISYLTRPISLSVRLFANMMAGHTMLKVFAGFVIGLGFLGGWAPLAFMVAFTGLEILVAFLQAYVFAILTCIYLNDALHMHH